MKELKFTDTFFEKNRQRLLKKIDDNSAVIIPSAILKSRSNDTFYRFRQDSNFFYLTGLEIERAILIMYKKGKDVKTILHRKVLDPTMEKWIGKNFPEDKIKEIAKITDIRNIKELDGTLNSIFGSLGIEKAYMYNEPYEGDVVPSYTQMFANNLKKRFPFVRITALNPILNSLRSVKQQVELKMIRRAIEITKLAFDELYKTLKPGMFEYEAEAVMISNYIKHGARAHAFQPIFASGEEATTLHYEENSKKTGANDLLLCDTGAEYNNYAADITRTIPVKGKFSETQKKFYSIVLEANKEVMKAVKPGVTLNELQEISKKTLFEGMKAIKMVKKIEDISEYYYHGVSHHMGIDVHDVADRNKPLEKGCVITVEPGLYIAEKKIGIRLENDVLVTETGHENMSKDIPIEIEEIEQRMKS